MNQLLFTIIFILIISSCTNRRADISQNNQVTTNQKLVKDSIDKYGFSGCITPFHNELNGSFIKALDSAWNILLLEDQTNKSRNIYSKEKFKASLMANDFVVDSSDEWIIATKRNFNERWRAEWQKDSNYVQLSVTRWYYGYTYGLFIGKNMFYK